MKKTRFLQCILALALAFSTLTPTRAAPRCLPTPRFVALDGGLVRDTLTGLLWQQQSSGNITWALAQTYCSSAGAGFRLPTVKELLSLVDLTATTAPMIDGTAFPRTPPENFWTSSLHGAETWIVSFNLGHSGHELPGSSSYRVRCVR